MDPRERAAGQSAHGVHGRDVVLTRPIRAARLLGACAALLLGACTHRGHDAATAERGATRTWTYRVHATPGASELRVDVRLPPGVPEELGVDAFAHPYLDELELETTTGWRPLVPNGRRWLVPACHERGCHLRYRYRLGEAARRIDRFAYAGYRSGVLMAPPSTFLLAPQDYSGGDDYQLHVQTAPGESFVSGVWSAGSDWSAPAALLFEAPFSGFGRFERQQLVQGDSRIDLAIAPGETQLRVSRAALRAALERAASAVAGYYGRFPVPEATVIVLPSAGDDIFAMQLGNGGASIVLFLGVDVDEAKLERDWVMTHELLHLGFPTLGRQYLWLAEGLATYQEPLVRARAGIISEADVWRGFVTGFPRGLPSGSDGGLDGSTRWGRTYWGGALVFLLLDLELRGRSGSQLSLDAAARAILERGGNTAARWTARETLAAGDAALDQPSLSEAYARYATAPVVADLDALYRRLGVRVEGERVLFDESAELAPVRRALTGAVPEAAHGAQSAFSVPGEPKSPL